MYLKKVRIGYCWNFGMFFENKLLNTIVIDISELFNVNTGNIYVKYFSFFRTQQKE